MANILVNFLFSGNSAPLVSAAGQASGALARFTGRLANVNTSTLASAAGLAGLTIALKSLLGAAIETSAEFQRLGTSFVSILASPILDAQKGAALTEEQLKGLRIASVAIFREAQQAAIDTVATTKEYVSLLQAALAVGQKQGLTQEQVLVITKRLALAAGAFGIDFEKASTAIAQILSGSVRVTNQLGRNLGLATAEQRKALQASIAQGTLYDFLEKKTRNFAATAKEVANNFLNVKAAIFDIFQIGGTEAIKPLFNFINEELVKFRDTFIGGKGQFLTPALQSIISGIQQFFKDIIPSLRILFNEFGGLLSDLGSKSGAASTVFKLILGTITEIVKLLRQAVNLEGVGGLIAGALLFRTALNLVVPILETLVYGFLNLRNNIVLVNTATTAFGQRAAAIGIVSSLGKFAGFVGIALSLAFAFKDLFVNADKAADAIERVDKQLESFRERGDAAAKNANLTDLIAEYKQLSAQQDRSIDDQIRLAQVTAALKTVLDDTGLAAAKAGKLSADAFKTAQLKLNDQLSQRVAELKQLQEALAVVAKGPPQTLSGGGNFTLEPEQAKKYEEQKQVLSYLAQKYIPDYDAALLSSKDNIRKYNQEVSNQIDKASKQIESNSLLTKTYDELVAIVVEANKAGKDNYEASQKGAAAHAAIYVNLLREADGNRQVAAANATTAIEDTKRTITSLENAAARIAAEEQYRIAIDETTSAIIVNTALASDIVDINEKIAVARTKIAELLSARAELTARPTPSAKKAHGGKQRDELKDLLSELQKQLGLLKTVGDTIEKEADRFISFRVRILQQLGEAGAIPFQIALDAEESLIKSQLQLDEKLISDRQEFIRKTQGELGQLVAEQQRGKARGTTNKLQGQITAKESEIKAAQQELENLNKSRIDGETKLFEIGQKGAAFRIKNLQEELKLREQLSVEDQKARADLLSQAAGAGFASPEEALRKQFEADKAERDQRKREIERSIYPWLDPALSGRALAALKEIQALVSKEANAAAFASLNQAAENVKNLGQKFEALDRARTEAFKAKKPTAALDEEISKTSLALDESVIQILELSKGLHLSGDEAKRLGEALAFALARGVTEETKRKAAADTQKLKEDTAKAERDQALQEIKLAEDRLNIEGKFLDFSASQLDIRQQILETEKELSIITDLEYRKQSASLIQQKILLLENQKALKEAQLRGIDTKIAASGGVEKAAPSLIESKLALEGQLNEIGQQFFELKNKAFDLTSPLLAVRDAFHQIADAVGALPEPFNKLKSVFSGFEHLADVLVRKQRPKAPEIVFTEASNTFNKSVTTFTSAVERFAALIGRPSGQQPGTPSTSTQIPDIDPTGRESRKKLENEAKKTKLKINEKVATYIRTVGTIASELLAGIASGDKGQIISSIGASLQAIPDPSGITQAIGAGVEIIGGFVSFFGASAKKKTHEMAVAITQGIDELKHAISTGAIGLGQGIRELQLKLEDARRRLSGRKGGAEELAGIEKDINAEIQRLRDEAKRIQDDFHEQLDLLRSPIALRDLITKINGIGDAAKKFLQSFETAEEAAAALADAQEFVKRSIQELEDEIKKSLSSLQDDLKSATDKFLSDQRSILLEGRIDPAVSIAQSKRQRLVELSQQFNKQRQELEDQIKGEQTKLDYVKSREKLEEKIARWTRVGADALSNAADKLTNAADALQRTFSTIGTFPFSGSGIQPTGGSLGTLNITVNGQPAGSLQLGISAVKQLELSGQISPSRAFGFNPV